MVCLKALVDSLKMCVRVFLTVLRVPMMVVLWMIGWSISYYGNSQTTVRAPTKELHVARGGGTLWPLKLIVDAHQFNQYAACRKAR